MVIDSSAIVAIALLEDTWQELSSKILSSTAIIATPTVLETYMVLRSRLGNDTNQALSAILDHLKIKIVPFDSEHLREARDAFEQFGKGRHPAALNFGDCVSYGLAKSSGQPLLYVGADFTRTDISQA